MANNLVPTDPYPLAHWCVCECLRAGVSLRVDGSTLRASPRERLTDEIRDLIGRCKPAVLTCLTDWPGAMLSHLRRCQESAGPGYGQPLRWFTETSLWGQVYGGPAVLAELRRLEREGLVAITEDRQGQRPVPERRVRVI